MRMMIVAGEASSDRYAALLVQSLRKRDSELEVFGMGGSQLRAVGVETIVDSEKSASVMGFTEVVHKLAEIRRAFQKLVTTAHQLQPDIIVLLDYAEFNMLLAKKLHEHFKLVYFIPPQVWAWRKGRVRAIKRYFQKVLSIFPFEKRFYEAAGVPVRFVGHPLTMFTGKTQDREQLRTSFGIAPAERVVGLLPGSRKAEVRRLLPAMLAAFGQLALELPGVKAIIPVAPNLDPSFVEDIVSRSRVNALVVPAMMGEVLTVADVAVVASGTATVEVALANVPMVIVYKLSPLSYLVGKTLVQGVENFGMPNLILECEAYKELLQGEVTPEKICAELFSILNDPIKAQLLRAAGDEVRLRLTTGEDSEIQTALSPIDRAAQEILATL